MTDKKNILVFIEALDHYNFFNRISKTLVILGYEIIFITHKLSLFRKSKKDNNPTYLIRKSINKNYVIPDLKNSLEVKANFLNYKSAELNYTSVYNLIDFIHSNKSIDIMFIFGGFSISGIAQNYFAEQNRIPTLFFELSNIPGKIFADPKGTNAKSSININPKILDNYKSGKKEQDIWIAYYINSKLKQKDIPQSEKRKKINWRYFIDWFGFVFLRIPKGTNRGLFKQSGNKLMIKFFNLKSDHQKLNQQKYIFYPMQVSSDSQILINSNYSNLQAIDYAIQVARQLKMKLIVKPHPAEKSYSEIKNIKLLKAKTDFIISDMNTFDLIQNAEEIITINSTVGLESLILKKKVTFLGDSIYKNFNNDLLMNYLFGYLIDIDYFSNEPISEESAKQLLERIYFRESNSENDHN